MAAVLRQLSGLTRRRCLAALVACGAAVALHAAAAPGPSVALAGQMGSKALLVIDGEPVTLAVGESARGVKLLQLAPDTAQVERGGVLSTLRSGAAPVALGGGVPVSGAREVVIPVGAGGHFVTSGSINGRPVRFMVDTGATLVAMGKGEAERLGIDLRQAESGVSQTAGGLVRVQLIKLASVKVGEVELYNVAAVVVPGEMPQVLLGNSFLSRMQMRRENHLLRLELKP
jgi:aspartyl protease family protein